MKKKIEIGIIDKSLETRNMLETHFAQSLHFHLSVCFPSFEEFERTKMFKKNISLLLLGVDESGIESLPLIRHVLPNTKIVMYTHIDSQEHILQAFQREADGYALKNTPLNVLEQLMLSVFEHGGALLSPTVSEKLVAVWKNEPEKTSTVPKISLSAKEKKVLLLLSSGKSYEDAATEAGMKIDSVRYYVKQIYRKLNVNNKTQMLCEAQQLGFLKNKSNYSPISLT